MLAWNLVFSPSLASCDASGAPGIRPASLEMSGREKKVRADATDEEDDDDDDEDEEAAKGVSGLRASATDPARARAVVGRAMTLLGPAMARMEDGRMV